MFKLHSKKILNLILLIGFFLSIMSGWYAYKHYDQEEKFHAELKSKEVLTLIKNRIVTYEQVLRSGVGLFNASENVTRNEWKIFTQELKLQENFKGIQGFGYSEVVLPQNIQSHEEQIRKEGFPNYRIKPKGKREFYTPVVYLEPFDERNKKALGYDVYSEKTRREAITKAILSAKATITGKVTLVQENDKDIQAGFLMYIPVYKKGFKVDTPSDRTIAIKGLVGAPFRANDLMNGILGNELHTVDFAIYDGSLVTNENLLYNSDTTNKSKKLFKKVALSINGHTWTIVFTMKELLKDSSIFILMLIPFFILMLTYLLYLLMKSLIRTKEDAQSIAEELTKKLEISKESLENKHKLLQKIIDLAPVRMFWKDMDGVYLGANKQFVEDAQLNDVSQMIGKTDYDMTWKESAQQFREDDVTIVNSGVPRLQYEEEQAKEDGSCIYLVTSKVPLRDIHDNIIGILGVYNDITESKLLQQEAEAKDKQLLMQSRMAQMGEMISMIAHQWRQPLSAISATAADLKVKLTLETFDLSVQTSQDEFNNYFISNLENIEEYTVNLSNTINDFRNFYKPNKDTQSIKLEDILNKALSIIESSMRSDNIEIITNSDCQQELELHDGELMHVFLNILKNTQDNFNERNIQNPRLIIDVKDTEISFTDNGGGISEDILEKIFDPYFSTKDEKNGTGLGLYMSKKIVEDHHNGKVDALNTDNGVCFRINLGKS